MRRLLPALCALLLLASSAWAEGESRDEQQRFSQGLEQFRRGEYTRAIEIWTSLRQSMGLQRGWKVLYNLGRAYEASADATKAVEHFAEFIATAERQPEDVRAESAGPLADATQRLDALKASHGALVVPAPKGGVVWVRVGLSDPRPAGFTLYLRPGAHRVVFAEGSPEKSVQEVTLEAGKETRLAPPESPTPPPTSEPRQSEPEKPKRKAETEPRQFPTLWVIGGAAATLATGALSTVLYLDAKDRRDEAAALGAANPGYPTAKDDYESAGRLYQYSLVLPAVFAVATATIVVVHVASSGDEPATQVGLGIGPGSVSVQGAF
ncbi:MAG: hypothetical protein R3B13_29970 [Polyangiaceae bacterium]